MSQLYQNNQRHYTKHQEEVLVKTQHNFSETLYEAQSMVKKNDEMLGANIFTIIQSSQRVIPGYNFESLFRKKSHIRLARKKNKEQTQKKNPSLKHELNQKQTKNIQKGHWTNEQNKLYHWFLQLHNRHFVLKYLRRTDKIFKSMANFIRTREAEQCRSHHQKMQKKYQTFYQILGKLRMEFYGTIKTDLLGMQLEQNGYKMRENTLISQNQIKQGDCSVRQSKIEQMEDSLGYPQDVSADEKGNNNILAENYQSAFQFANIHH